MTTQALTNFQRARVGPKRIGAYEFLRALFGPYYTRGGRGFIEIRVIGPKRAKSYFFRGLEGIEKKRFESQKVHTYYGLLPREIRDGKKEAVKWLVALWGDLDEKNFSGGKEEAWEKLAEFPFPPSIVIDSGHGLQAVWFLEEPVEIQEAESAEGYLRGLAKALQGDPAVCEIARVFRLPASFNVKDAKHPILVKVKLFMPRRRYALSDFGPWKEASSRPQGENQGKGIQAETAEGLGKVEACKFVRFANLHAKGLAEPLWWSLLTNLLPFKGGRERAHEMSKPYEKGANRYSFKETERKIEHILARAPGPHTCRKIVEHGYPCSFVGVCPVEAPAGLAWADPEFVSRLSKEPAA